MKLTTFARNLHDLNQIREQGLSEVILGHRDFSRFGTLNDQEFKALKTRAKELGLRVIFEWDILMTQKAFEESSAKITGYLENVDALRVQDPGAFHWALNETQLPFQFVAENGNHNLEGLKSWQQIGGDRLERLILSIELSKEALKTYLQELTVPCELLGLGRILLFYTPRALLTPLSPEKIAVNTDIQALGSSEESPHKGFPLLENKHGTFMFHIKEFCLLEYAAELKEMGLSFFRVDLRWEGMELFPLITKLTSDFSSETFEELKAQYSQDFMRGFYLVNKTDVLFPKLKNNRLQNRQGNFVGEVLEAEKGSHLAILVRNARGLKKSDQLQIVHPKGETFEVPIYSLRNSSLQEVDEVQVGSLALVQYVGGVWVKSQVFLR